eukprot:m.122151 g.122151  ORF g.122151 m.122151 type:complete len:390 (-) comp28903_c0_seq2:350-1519(-)
MWSSSSSPTVARASQSHNMENLTSPKAIRLAMESVRLDSEIAHLKQRAAAIEISNPLSARSSYIRSPVSTSYIRSPAPRSPSRPRSVSPVRRRSMSPTRSLFSPTRSTNQLNSSLSEIRYRNAKFLARLSGSMVTEKYTSSSSSSIQPLLSSVEFEKMISEFESVIQGRDVIINEYAEQHQSDETELIKLRAQLKAEHAIHNASIRGVEAQAQIHIAKAQESLKTATEELIAEYNCMHEESHQEVAEKHSVVEALRDEVASESNRLNGLMDSLIQKENDMNAAIKQLQQRNADLDAELSNKQEYVVELESLVKNREAEVTKRDTAISGLESELSQWRRKYGHNFIPHGERAKSPRRSSIRSRSNQSSVFEEDDGDRVFASTRLSRSSMN